VATNVILPVLGMSQEKGTIVRWLKPEGAPVAAGEPLLEVETDKAVAEIEAPAGGILARIFAAEGEEVPVAQVIALILSKEEAALEHFAGPAQADPPPREARTTEAELPPADQARSGAISPRREAGRILASPKARRLALEHGMALEGVTGSGPGGAVIAADIAAAAFARPEPSLRSEARTVSLPAAAPQPERVEAAVVCSLQRQANAARLLEWQARRNARRIQPVDLTDLLLAAAARTLARHSILNGQPDDAGEVNIAFVVAVEDGAALPVIARASRLRLDDLSARRLELAERARSGGLRPEDLSGATFTLTHLEQFGVEAMVPGLSGGQAAHLSVGTIVERPSTCNGQAGLQPVTTLTLTFDPRRISITRAARFLQEVVEALEEPLLLLS